MANIDGARLDEYSTVYSTIAYVDAIATGLDPKASCRVATTTTLPTYTHSAGVLTATANGAFPTTDGVTVALNNRILVKDETGGNAPYNGIYTLTQVGDGSNPWKLTRATDADNSPAGEVTSGMYTTITEGTANTGNQYVLTTPDTITLGTTSLTFALFASTTAYEKVANKDATNGYAGLSNGYLANSVIGLPQATRSSTATLTGASMSPLNYVDATSGAITLTLNAPSSYKGGKFIIFTKIDATANTVTITLSTTSFIDGTTSRTIYAQGQGIFIVPDTTNSKWHILSEFGPNEKHYPWVTKTVAGTIGYTERSVLCSNATGADYTLTLPAAATVGNGARFVFKKTDAAGANKNIILDGNASETIDGATTYTLDTQYESVTLVSDGSNWFVVA